MGDPKNIHKMGDPPTPEEKRAEQRYRDNMAQFGRKRGCMVYFLIGFGVVVYAFFKTIL